MNQKFCRLQIYNFDRILNKSVEINDTRRFLKKKNKGIQTDYRESETQTDPWKPDILMSWDNEIEKIERRKIKESWEKLLSPVDCNNKETRESIITMIDQEEWKFRNKELEEIANWRLRVMKDILRSENQKKNIKIGKRFEQVRKYLNEIREKEIENIKNNFLRNLGKLDAKYRESSMKFKFHDNKFESTGDLIDKEWLEDYNEDDKKSNLVTSYLSKNPLKGTKQRARMPDELCIRETRWTDEQLKKLHNDLKKIRLNTEKNTNY